MNENQISITPLEMLKGSSHDEGCSVILNNREVGFIFKNKWGFEAVPKYQLKPGDKENLTFPTCSHQTEAEVFMRAVTHVVTAHHLQLKVGTEGNSA